MDVEITDIIPSTFSVISIIMKRLTEQILRKSKKIFKSLLKLFRKEGPVAIYDVLREYLRIVSARCFVVHLFKWCARDPMENFALPYLFLCLC